MPNFTFSTSLGGSTISHPLDMGTVSNTGGQNLQPVYVEHDSVSDLQNAALYIQPFSGTSYVGLYGENEDYIKTLDWGTNANKGLITNLVAADTNATGDKTFLAGSGANSQNAIPFDTSMFGAAISTSLGHFPAGETAHYTLKLGIPASETSVGLRMISQWIRFDQ